jgi:hypothetical protein
MPKIVSPGGVSAGAWQQRRAYQLVENPPAHA